MHDPVAWGTFCGFAAGVFVALLGWSVAGAARIRASRQAARADRIERYLTQTTTRYAADMDRWLAREEEWRKERRALTEGDALLREGLAGEIERTRVTEWGRQVKGAE